MEAGGEIDIKAELLAKLSFEKELKMLGADGPLLFTVPLEPITVPVYGIPLVITPKIEVYLGMDYKGEVYAQFKLFSAELKGGISYVYTREPDPTTGEKHNIYKDGEAKILGDGNLEKMFQKWLAPKVGIKASAKFLLEPMVTLSVYDANDIFNLGLVPLNPWVKVEGDLSITKNDETLPELDYDDQITIDGGVDIGVSAHFKLLGKEENWMKTFTLFETELFNPFGLTPRFDDLLVTPDENPIPATTPAIGFDMYMTKPNIQLLPDQDYGFAYGPKDEPNRKDNWTFVSLKKQYDPEFDGDLYKRQHIQTAIDPATVQPGVPYRVSPYVQLFGATIYKKGENFTLDDSTPCVTVPVAEVDFGDVLVGACPTQVLDIVNNSALPQTVTVEVTPPFSIAYDESSMSSRTIEVPGNSCSPVTIMFTATSEGDYLGTATFTSNAIEGCPIVVPLHANVVTDEPGLPVIAVNPTSIDFGVVEYGTDETSTLTVTNTSHATVTIMAQSDPSFTDYFEISDNNVTKILVPGASMNYTVTAHGIKTGFLAVTNLLVSCGSGEPQLVALSAQGRDNDPLLDASSVSLNPGEQTVVWARSGNCTMTNSNENAVHVWQSGGSGGGGGREEPPYVSNVSSSTSRFTVEALSNGTATVVIKDEYSGREGVLTITVGEGDVNTHEWVDLGLPSGTLWATCNVGASSPEEYGDYFAWGETEPKDNYSWSTYKWCNDYSNALTKYCTSGFDGIVDSKTELDPEDDAAYVNWGENWRIPTHDQQKELWTECTWTWTTQNGVNGRLVTGPNGNTLFLPAAGYRLGGSLDYAGSYGYYWSRKLVAESPYLAQCLNFSSGDVRRGAYYRSGGLVVRAVRVSQN